MSRDFLTNFIKKIIPRYCEIFNSIYFVNNVSFFIGKINFRFSAITCSKAVNKMIKNRRKEYARGYSAKYKEHEKYNRNGFHFYL